MNNNDKQVSDGEAKAKPEVIKLGLDLHARQVTECRQLDGSTPKSAQKWDPWKLLNQVEEWVKAGIKVYSCYEDCLLFSILISSLLGVCSRDANS
jgi:hypothetical protein